MRLFAAVRRMRGPLVPAARCCSHSTVTRASTPLSAIAQCPPEWANVDTQRFGLRVVHDFVSESEASAVASAVLPDLSKRKYEDGHWDGVIVQYREAQLPRKKWKPGIADVSARVAALFPQEPLHAPWLHPAAGSTGSIGSGGSRTGPLMPMVHALELSASGSIGSHVDSIKFSGSVVAGLCLLSDAVLQLTLQLPEAGTGAAHADAPTTRALRELQPPPIIRVLLPQRCVYIMSGQCRYYWAHAILGADETAAALKQWSGPALPAVAAGAFTRGRRLSLMYRDELSPAAEAAGPPPPALPQQLELPLPLS